MRTFRFLKADEIECRISEIDKQGRYLKLLLYKTARTDAALLDEVYGSTKWQNDYKTIDGKLFCGIAIKDGTDWIWKWNVGSESNIEAEKGQASDAFKRAGFVLGIGTELYSSPEIMISKDKCNIKEYNGKYRCYDKFTVAKIDYDANQNISNLIITNSKTGDRAFTWSKVELPLTPEERSMPMCEGCGAMITDYISEIDGKVVKAQRHSKKSFEKYHQVLCLDCIRKREDNAGQA